MINSGMKLAQLANAVGERNVESILSANSISRTPNIGRAMKERCSQILQKAEPVDAQRKMTLLNTITDSAELFETVALLNEPEWSLFSAAGLLMNTLKIPETIKLPNSFKTIGDDGVGISNLVYKKCMNSLKRFGIVSPEIFNEYSSTKSSQIIKSQSELNHTIASDPFQWFNIPWGQITLYSSLGKEGRDIPVYPEELSDGRAANYTQMPDMLYQYEPWQVYQSSGPRSNTYTFRFHRDMWSGNHTNPGGADELIRFCEANCYPEYNGSSVNTATVTLYIAGKAHITGVLTGVNYRWSGPIGHDGFYLYCELELSITEVSPIPLNYTAVRSKGLIS